MTNKKRQAYRLRHWPDSNKALTRRGSLTLWVGAEVLEAWREHERTGRRGGSRTYSATAILTMATLMEVYGLPLRATRGLLLSVVELLGVELPVPCFTTLSRRRQSLAVALPRLRKSEPLHLVVDSTGVKIYGEGEWKVRRFGWSKRRTWRKLHLGVDEATGEVAAAVSTNSCGDGQALPCLLSQVAGEIKQVTGDGGYDDRRCYDAIRERQARAVMPPPQGARIWQHGNTKGERHDRDENLRSCRRHGRAKWKRESGYHRRSLAEVAVFRRKTVFGERASARSFAGQARQLLVRCAALNRMTQRRDAGQLQGRGIRSVQLEGQLRSSSFMQQSHSEMKCINYLRAAAVRNRAEHQTILFPVQQSVGNGDGDSLIRDPFDGFQVNPGLNIHAGFRL